MLPSENKDYYYYHFFFLKKVFIGHLSHPYPQFLVQNELNIVLCKCKGLTGNFSLTPSIFMQYHVDGTMGTFL